MISAAKLILANCGITYGTRRLFRLVDKFQRRAPNASGMMFFQYLAASVQLTADQQQHALLNSDVARFVMYADPTGEQAVNHVLRERGW